MSGSILKRSGSKITGSKFVLCAKSRYAHRGDAYNSINTRVLSLSVSFGTAAIKVTGLDGQMGRTEERKHEIVSSVLVDVWTAGG